MSGKSKQKSAKQTVVTGQTVATKQVMKPALTITNLSKSFKLPVERVSGVKQAIVNAFRGIKGYREFRVLQDINFEVQQGDFFGIIGRNGSGKSTLLKLISQIYTPNSGGIDVQGKLVPFIELGVGFNMELTGRENIYMNGALLGFSKPKVDEMYDDIVDFAELADFMEQKLKNYSSGMQVRLAFAIAIKAQADILVLDEVLAVGDEAFQRKCNEYFQNLKRNKKTVILVTHDMGAVRKYCNKALLLKDGEIVKIGSPEDVANEYSMLNLERFKHDARIDGLDVDEIVDENDEDSSEQETPISSFEIKLLTPNVVTQNQLIEVEISYECAEDIPTRVAVDMYDMTRQMPLTYDSNFSNHAKGKGVHKVKYSTSFPQINDTSIMVIPRIRLVESDGQDKILGYIGEEHCPKLILKRDDIKTDLDKRQSGAVIRTTGKFKAITE